MARDGFTRRVSQADQFMPVRRLAAIGRSARSLRQNRRRKRECHGGRAGQIAAVAEESPRPRKRDRNNRSASNHRPPERPKLEGGKCLLLRESGLQENEKPIALAQAMRPF